jgi:hypothetical protein
MVPIHGGRGEILAPRMPGCNDFRRYQVGSNKRNRRCPFAGFDACGENRSIGTPKDRGRHQCDPQWPRVVRFQRAQPAVPESGSFRRTACVLHCCCYTHAANSFRSGRGATGRTVVTHRPAFSLSSHRPAAKGCQATSLLRAIRSVSIPHVDDRRKQSGASLAARHLECQAKICLESHFWHPGKLV